MSDFDISLNLTVNEMSSLLSACVVIEAAADDPLLSSVIRKLQEAIGSDDLNAEIKALSAEGAKKLRGVR